MKKTNSHKWVFVSRFRTNAYGSRASKLACKRIKEAVSEIKKVTRKDPVLGAEGSIKFMEKLWPALQHVDLDKNPKFALGVAIASLHWLAEGWGYEITGSDVYSAYDYAMKAAEHLGITDQVKADIVKIVSADKSLGMLVKDILGRHLDLRKIK